MVYGVGTQIFLTLPKPSHIVIVTFHTPRLVLVLVPTSVAISLPHLIAQPISSPNSEVALSELVPDPALGRTGPKPSDAHNKIMGMSPNRDH